MTATPRIVVAAILAVALVLTTAFSPLIAGADPARPSPSRLTFHCKLAVTNLGLRIKVAYRMISSGPRSRWNLRFADNARTFALTPATAGPRGGFVVIRRTPNQRGRDRVVVTGTQVATGATCRIRILVHPRSGPGVNGAHRSLRTPMLR
jgi:hypothetical protein